MTHSVDRLKEIMVRLRDPNGGCPWDVEQTFETIAPYTIEEAYEVADAIERADMEELKVELGDLLFVVANLARKLEVEPEDALRALSLSPASAIMARRRNRPAA